MACSSGGNETLREKLIDVMYENEQLKAENSKLRELLEKSYEFMKQFVLDGRNLLERFMESVGQVVEKVRDGIVRKESRSKLQQMQLALINTQKNKCLQKALANNKYIMYNKRNKCSI